MTFLTAHFRALEQPPEANMLLLIFTFLGCSSVQGAESVDVMSDDWHGLEKRILQLDCDGNLDEDTAEAVVEK